MALKIIDYGTPEYQQMIKMREDILRKPLGLNFDESELESEKNNLLIAAFDDDKMLGCCMLVPENENIVRLRQMAVLNDLQGKGIGRALMDAAIAHARRLASEGADILDVGGESTRPGAAPVDTSTGYCTRIVSVASGSGETSLVTAISSDPESRAAIIGRPKERVSELLAPLAG